MFGPYMVRNRPYNTAEYIRLLTEEVFSDIHRRPGNRKWGRAIWQQVCHDLICLSLYFTELFQDGATIHTANHTMTFLDGIFGARVFSGRQRQGQYWYKQWKVRSGCLEKICPREFPRANFSDNHQGLSTVFQTFRLKQ